MEMELMEDEFQYDEPVQNTEPIAAMPFKSQCVI